MEDQTLTANEQSDHEQKLFERCKRHFESPDINRAVFVVKSMKEIHAQLQKRIDKYSKDILCMWYGNFLRNGKVEDRDFFFLTKLGNIKFSQNQKTKMCQLQESTQNLRNVSFFRRFEIS